MSIERKDVRFKLDADRHAALAVVAHADEVDIGEWCEHIINKEIDRRVHTASLIAAGAGRLGISGKGRE